MVNVRINAGSIASHSLGGLTQRYLPRLLGLVAIGLALPGIFQGWAADDLVHRVILLNRGLGDTLGNLFVFASPAVNDDLIRAGALPWWTVPDLTVAFFRPLAAVSHWLDYRLFPHSATLMHLHNALWYGVVCWLAALVYRQVMGRSWVAGLAGLLFVVDLGHIGLTAWLANRNALIALALGLYMLYKHVQWRAGFDDTAFNNSALGAGDSPITARRAAPWGALLAFAGALLASEAAIAALAYVVAYEIFPVGQVRSRRGLALVLYGAVAGAWWLGYGALGYGLAGTGFYTDPGAEPLRFLGMVAERGPLLLAAQGLGVAPVLFGYLSDEATRLAWGIAPVVLAGGAICLTPLARTDRSVRFWLLGMLLALVPACTTRLLGSRQLLFVSLGAMALTAQFIQYALARRATPHRPNRLPSPTGAMAILLLALHLLVPLLLLPLTASASDRLQDVVETVLPLSAPTMRQAEQVFVVNAPSPFHFLYWPAMDALTGEAQLAQPRVLAPGYATVTLTRVDDRTLLVRTQQGFYPAFDNGPRPTPARSARMDEAYMYEDVASFFRDTIHPLPQGQEIGLEGMTVQVVEQTTDARPLAVRMVFAHSLEDATYGWLRWNWDRGAYEPFTPPPIGGSIELPGPL